MSFLEALSETFLVFYVFVTLPPAVSLLVMCGVCRIESILDYVVSINEIQGYFQLPAWVCKIPKICQRKRKDYDVIPSNPLDDAPKILTPTECKRNEAKRMLLILCLVCLAICQVGGIVAVAIFLGLAYTDNIASTVSIVINSLSTPSVILLSFTWFGWLQKKLTYQPRADSIEKAKMTQNCEKNVTAKWKSSKIIISVFLTSMGYS